LKDPGSLIDLIVFMDEEGLVPDHQIKHALIRALTPSPLIPFLSSSSSAKDDEPSLLSRIMKEDDFVSVRLKQKYGIEPAEVWHFENWNSLKRSSTQSSIISRSSVPVQVGGSPRFTESSSPSSFSIPSSSSSSTGSSSMTPPVIKPKGKLPVSHSQMSSPKQQFVTPRKNGSSTVSDHGASFQPPQQRKTVADPGTRETNVPVTSLPPSSSPPSSSSLSLKFPRFSNDRWSSFNLAEGNIPVLSWYEIEKTTAYHPVTGERKSFATSKKLHRLIRLGEDQLMRSMPHLFIDLSSSSSVGMSCPGTTCSLQRSLYLGEIVKGWESYNGDPNKYTTKCVYCGREFIPRFSIQIVDDHHQTHVNKDEASTKEEGAKITGTRVVSSVIQWCELLSPWVLHKEIMNIIFEDGITSIILNDLLSSSSSSSKGGAGGSHNSTGNKTHQRSVVFWNMIIYYRLRGLPFSFLLTNGTICEAFPTSSISSTAAAPSAAALAMLSASSPTVVPPSASYHPFTSNNEFSDVNDESSSSGSVSGLFPAVSAPAYPPPILPYPNHSIQENAVSSEGEEEETEEVADLLMMDA
jgi:hypothetical protein